MIFEKLADAIRTERPVALVTRLDGAHAGAKLLVFEDGDPLGDLGTPGLNHAATEEARAQLTHGENTLRSFGEDGEPVGMEVRLFIASYAPKPIMYVFGAIDFSRAMAKIAKYVGYRVVVVDARPVFATKARIPDADEIVVQWPDEFMKTAHVDKRTALVVLTHDPKFDIPLLQVALKTNAGYIGAMGSRRTHANRLEALRAEGVSEDAIARISAPIGLDLGARTPEETAISIVAEIVALREGRDGGRLSTGARPVHNERSTVAL